MPVTNEPMRVFALSPVLVLVAVSVLAAAGCPAELTEVCSLPGALPEDVDEGRGSATLDGAPFEGRATWSPGSDASITIGLLTMSVAKDVTGTDFDELIANGALPICVPQGERSGTSGNAAYNESPGFVTDAANTGSVALLSFENDVLVGRFAFDLVNSGSAQTLEFKDGVFAATRFE